MSPLVNPQSAAPPLSTSPAPKRILILGCCKTFPACTGGNIHTAGIARAFTQMGFRVEVYALAGRRENYGKGTQILRDEIEPGLVEVTNLGWPLGLLQTVGRRLGYPRVWLWWLLTKGLVPKTLKESLEAADYIFCDQPYNTIVPGPWASKPWYLISHNLEHRLLEQGTPQERRFGPWMKRLEVTAPQRYRDIFSCADEDQAFFRQHDPDQRCAVPLVGSAIDPSQYVAPAGTRERVRRELGVADDETLIVFSGSRFQPNLDALETLKAFCGEEAEFLKASRIRFLILGTMEPQPYQQGALIATGRVPEVTPYFVAADAGLNPVTWGSGANVKLFEYLAVRLPVLSTRSGVRGTELAADRDYLEFEPGRFRATLEQFRSLRTREEWRGFAEEVWSRHRHYCDIIEVTKRAAVQLTGFAT